MRLVTATALALAGAVSIATLQAQGMNMQDTAHKVPNGGIRGAGWQGRPDPGTGAVTDSSIDVKGSDLEIHTGPAMLYWNTANKTTGDFTISATFNEPKYMSSNDHPHPYGVFIAGNDLDGANATALYCVVYGNGNVTLRAFPTTFTPQSGYLILPGANGGHGGQAPITKADIHSPTTITFNVVLPLDTASFTLQATLTKTD